MDLTRAPSSSLLLPSRQAGRRKHSSCSVGADNRTNEQPTSTTRREEDNNDKIIAGSSRLTGSSRQRLRKDLTTTTTAATLVTMKGQTQKIREAAAVNDDDEPEMRQQVQMFARRKSSRRTEEGGKKQALRKTASTNGRQASSSTLLGAVGGGYFNALASAAALSAVMVLLSAASQTTDAIKLGPEGKEKYYWSDEPFIISCHNNKNIKNPKFNWFGPNNQLISEDRSQRIHTEKNVPHAHRLIVMNSTPSVDDGYYTCTLGSTDDRTPRETTGFQLKLYKATSFLDTSNRVTLQAGKEGEIVCHVEFDSAALGPAVTWYRDNMPIENFNDPSYNTSAYDPVTGLSKLTIHHVNRNHAGIYTCHAAAEMPALSKISQHHITVEVHYKPTFEKESESVWVARRLLGIRLAASNNMNQQETNIYSNQAGQPQPGRLTPPQYSGPARRKPLGPLYANPSNKRQFELDRQPQSPSHQANSSEPLTIRVELNCTCQANPPAKLHWRLASSNLILNQENAPHVVNQTETITYGLNSSSVVVIDYVISPDWPHKNDQYVCSAHNQIGGASKTFTIEQGNPPPAFQLADPKPQYYPQDSMLCLTIGGPNSEQETAQLSSDNYDARIEQRQQLQKEGTPPVDSFRIRAEIPSAMPPAAVGDHQRHHQASNSPGGSAQQQQHWQRSSTNLPQGPFAEWILQPEEQQTIDSNLRGSAVKPVTFNVSLRNLPAGNQRLFLEAHNAVGWSPDSTYLGDFHIVSGAMASFLSSSGAAFYFQVVANLLVSFCIILGLARVY